MSEAFISSKMKSPALHHSPTALSTLMWTSFLILSPDLASSLVSDQPRVSCETLYSNLHLPLKMSYIQLHMSILLVLLIIS